MLRPTRGPGFGRALGFLLAAGLSGCAVGGCAVGGSDSGFSDKPDRELAGRPSALPSGRVAPVASGTATPPASGAPVRPGAGSARPSGGATTSAPSGGPTPTREPGGEPVTWRTVAEISDPAGDEEGDAPPYGDLAGVRLEEGGKWLRVTIFMQGAVPRQLPADEVLGTGIDFFRSLTQTESDYQLYVDGQPDGWFAYLHTPRGFVKYPGTFGIAANRLEFVIPWSAIGNPSSGRYSGFADWTRKVPVQNQSGEDHAPLIGSAEFNR